MRRERLQHAVPGVLEVEAEGQRLQEELVPEDVFRQELQVQAPRRLRQHRDGRGQRTVGPAPQHQVHPRVQDVGGGVFHDAVEVFAQPHLLRVFVAQGGVALQVGEVALLAQHGALIRLVGDADLGDQGQGHVGQRLPRREGFGIGRRVQAGEDAGEGARRRLLQGHDARLPGVLAARVGLVGSERPGALHGGARRYAEQLLAHRHLGVVAARLALPGLQEAGYLPVHARAVEALVPHPGHVEDAFAQHPQFREFLQDLRQDRLGQAVHVPQQRPLRTEQG